MCLSLKCLKITVMSYQDLGGQVKDKGVRKGKEVKKGSANE